VRDADHCLRVEFDRDQRSGKVLVQLTDEAVIASALGVYNATARLRSGVERGRVI